MTIALISHAGKILLQILLNRMWEKIEMELPDEQAGFRPGRCTADMLDIIQDLIEKLWASEAKPVLLSLTTANHSIALVMYNLLILCSNSISQNTCSGTTHYYSHCILTKRL